MLKYKIDILEELKKKGYTSYKIRKDKLIGEAQLTKIRSGEIASKETLNTICKLLNYQPGDILEYIETEKMLKQQYISVTCGTIYSDLFENKFFFSSLDHSIAVALICWHFTQDKKITLSGLFHDIATPCYSHVIDYMNEDYEKQESTEEYTGYILKQDLYLKKCLEEDKIDINDIIDFKKYSVVDNDRPKVCADRIDGVILTGIGWTKNINMEDINRIVDDITIFKNENNEDEIGFKTLSIAQKVLQVSESIDMYCHSNEDNYMMQLLADITKLAINKKYILYSDLYFYEEEQLFSLLKEKNDEQLNDLINKFETIKIDDIPQINLSNVKIRKLNPIVNGKRIKY